ncbi:hypothetical protein HMPREF9965_1113 [Streptococcus mitis bv. 2 str. SK95]|uniref:Uncharacterized protein n=1 Tax=Streptococcus mitis bv. 2 str. SK95 TaxID=1000588 RepID=F9LV81_STROR|nr:hypothetical protein HMPREF9965_1113 [Streptococcus mitis bv. 2 str. SK95]
MENEEISFFFLWSLLSFADFLEIKWYNEWYGKRKIACQYAKFK